MAMTWKFLCCCKRSTKDEQDLDLKGPSDLTPIGHIHPGMILPVSDIKTFAVYNATDKLFEKSLIIFSTFATYKDFMSWLFRDKPMGNYSFYIGRGGYWHEKQRIDGFEDSDIYRVVSKSGNMDYIIMTNLSGRRPTQIPSIQRTCHS
jgi:hypothetical protein